VVEHPFFLSFFLYVTYNGVGFESRKIIVSGAFRHKNVCVFLCQGSHSQISYVLCLLKFHKSKIYGVG
jgi:hypothetical protein